MKRRLRGVLAQQWIIFSVTLFAGFAAMALLLLFLLEDQFIDQRLRDVGDAVAAGAVDLPTGFARYSIASAPDAVHAAHRRHQPGAIRELRLPDGRYIHVLAEKDQHGEVFLLAYDVSDQLYINAALLAGWPWLLAMVILLSLAAWLLARRFVDFLARRADALVRALATAEDTTALRQLAKDEAVEEFALLARHGAEAWDARITALRRERETLAFLGHELRTPLQSACTSLNALSADRDNDAAWQRLQRAHQRLLRASDAILWLERNTAPTTRTSTAPAPLLDALIAEFQPLARQRGQSLQLSTSGELGWCCPAEIVETIAANLLMNAMQHGGPGPIEVSADANGFAVTNLRGADSKTAGFGLGLQLVERLLQKFGGSLSSADGPGTITMRVRLQTPP